MVLDRHEAYVLKEMHQAVFKWLLEAFILAKLEKHAPLAGYDFVGLIREQFDLALSPATIYSALYSLERKGMIKPAVERSIKERKRTYVLTKDGKEQLDINAKFRENLLSFLREMLAG